MKTATRILLAITVLSALVRPASGAEATSPTISIAGATTSEIAVLASRSIEPAPAETVPAVVEPAMPPVSLTPEVTVVGSAAQRAAVEESLATFASLGMALPDFTVRFHNDEAGCDNHMGLFEFTLDPWTLQVCSDLAFVIPHEIGHAWERANLTADDRATYMEARNIAEWQNLSLPTGEQAIEDIAFTIQKTILQGPDVNKDISATINLLWDLAAA